MSDAPDYRLWPPLALGLPLVAGFAASGAGLDPVTILSTARPLDRSAGRSSRYAQRGTAGGWH